MSSSVSLRIAVIFVSGSMNDLRAAVTSDEFLQFLQTDLQLVNEIFAGFNNFDFTVVAIGRSATAK